MPCKRLQPSYCPSTNSLTLVPTGTTEYIAAGDSQAAVPFPTEMGRDFDFQCKTASGLSHLLLQLAVTAGKWAFRRRALQRPHPARREVTCGDTDMDWPRLGAVLYTTGLWGRSYLGVGRRAASRTWQKLCQEKTRVYRDRRPGRANTSTGPGIRLLHPVWLPGVLGGFHQCSLSGELNWGRKKALISPGEGEWRSKHDTGQFVPPITCYPTHGKKLAQRGDCRILRRYSVSPSPQLCRCLPKRRRAPTHRRRQHSAWSEPSPTGGMARLETGTPRRRPPLFSGPTSVGDSLPFLLLFRVQSAVQNRNDLICNFPLNTTRTKAKKSLNQF